MVQGYKGIVIAGTGLGSRLSEGIADPRSPVRFVIPLLAVGGLVLLRMFLPAMITAHIAEPTWWRVTVTIACLFPFGTILGFLFPLGMRLIPAVASAAKPWYLALNGIFSVLFSAFAALIAIFQGISTNFDIAIVCYLLALVPLKILGGYSDPAVVMPQQSVRVPS